MGEVTQPSRKKSTLVNWEEILNESYSENLLGNQEREGYVADLQKAVYEAAVWSLM